MIREEAGDDLAGVPAHGDAVGVVAGGDVEAAAGVAADEGEAVGGFGAEAGPDGGERTVGQGGKGGEGAVEHLLDGAGAEASIEADAFLGCAEDDAAVGPLGEAAARDVQDVAEAEVGRIEGEHVALGGHDGDAGEEVGQPGAGGEDDLAGVEVAVDGADGGIGASADGGDVGSLVDVDAGGEQGAVDDGRPALGVDLAVGVDGGAGEVGGQEGFAAAGFVRFEEFDVEFGFPLPGDLVAQLLALFAGAGEADGGAPGKTDVESGEFFEELGEFGEGVATVKPEAEQGGVVVGVVLGADEAAGGGRGFAADASALEDGHAEATPPRGQRHGAADDATADDRDIDVLQIIVHAGHPATISKPPSIFAQVIVANRTGSAS